MAERGRLIVLAGPTAVGKGTVAAWIREHHPEIAMSVSATTRPPPPGEIDGTHYHFVSPEAGTQLTAYARANDPFAKVGQEAVNIEVVSVLPRTPHTYQVQWRETVYDQGGRGDTSNWTGLFTTTQRQPQNEAELRANPLGLLITSFQWSREL